MTQHRILLGVIGRPHGVRGHVRVVSHTADPADLTAYGPLTDDRGRRFTLRWRGEGVAEVTELRADGTAVKLTDRTAAEQLVNTRLYIDRAQLPEPGADEFYLADLIGMAAVTASGQPLGTVVTVHDYGAGTSLEIAHDTAPPLLVPFTHAAVPQVDLANRQLTIVPPVETASPPETPAPRGESPSSLRGEGWGEGGRGEGEGAAA